MWADVGTWHMVANGFLKSKVVDGRAIDLHTKAPDEI
jgi:hypothetical protein